MSAKKRALYLNTFPTCWGDGMLDLNQVRWFKKETPTSVVYGMLHASPATQFGHHAIYEGLLDLVIPVCEHVWSDTEIVNVFKKRFGHLSFDVAIVSWSSVPTVGILMLPNFQDARIIAHWDYAHNSELGIVDKLPVESRRIEHHLACDVSTFVQPVIDGLKTSKHALAIFPGSSNNLQCINKDGLMRIYESLQKDFNIILLGSETAFYGGSLSTGGIHQEWERVCQETTIINALGYSSIKQVKILEHCDIVLVTSGSVVHPMLYPKKAILVNTYCNKVGDFGGCIRESYKVVFPKCPLYPCEEFRGYVDQQGKSLCKANNLKNVSLCASTEINAEAIAQAAYELIGKNA